MINQKLIKTFLRFQMSRLRVWTAKSLINLQIKLIKWKFKISKQKNKWTFPLIKQIKVKLTRQIAKMSKRLHRPNLKNFPKRRNNLIRMRGNDSHLRRRKDGRCTTFKCSIRLSSIRTRKRLIIKNTLKPLMNHKTSFKNQCKIRAHKKNWSNQHQKSVQRTMRFRMQWKLSRLFWPSKESL